MKLSPKNDRFMKISRYAVLLSVLLLGACKSIQLGNQSGVLRTYRSHKVLEKVIDNQPDFQKMQAGKLNAKFMFGDKKFSSGGSVNYLEDSIFILSIQPLLGIELFRLEITKEHIMVLDKMNRRYVKESIDDLMQFMGNDMPLVRLDALLKNQLFAIGNDSYFQEKRESDATVVETQDSYLIRFLENEINHEFEVDKIHYGIDKVKLSTLADDGHLSVSYNSKQLIDDMLFPTVLLFEVVTPQFTGSCEINMSRISINDKVNVKPISLNRYKQMGLEEIMTIMNNK